MTALVESVSSATSTPVGGRVLVALATVRDPELDEPITSLGFVASCSVSCSGVAHVRLRLPTYFCAPNFAFLMVADAHDAVSAVEGIHSVEVVLEDHFAADAINSGVAARSGFVASFGDEAAAELDQLRADFLRKAMLAGTDRVCRPLVRAGVSSDELAAMTLGDLPPSFDRDRLQARRRELGLPSSDESSLLIDAATGASVGADALPMHLRRAQLTRVNIEANSGVCRGMLQARYGGIPGLGQSGQEEEDSP
jgi:metal-sulfur cluster biosynthetic enzyme